MPRFSIVIPAYNAESTLAETLDAVRDQLFRDLECVIVDDGSTDATEDIANSYEARDSRIRVVSQVNRGSGGAYNTGVRTSVGDFVVLCSADDVLLPEYLKEMAAFIDAEPAYDIYSTNGYFWRPGVSRELVYPAGTRDKVVSLTLADVIRVCFFSVGAAYRREWYDRVGGYRENVFGEDYDFWLRAMASGAKHRYLPKALSLHRVSPTQKSSELERAYRSDIRLVTDLRELFTLSDEENSAVEDSVAERERLLSRLSEPSPSHQARQIVFRTVSLLLGETWARRFSAWMRNYTRANRDV